MTAARLLRLLVLVGPQFLDQLWHQALWVVLAASLGVRFLGARFRPVLAFVLVMAAIVTVALDVVTTPVNEDTVFYLADAWRSLSDPAMGRLPMRLLLFRPFLLAPACGWCVVLANVTAVCIGIGCSLLAGYMAWRLSGSRFLGVAGGALLCMWLAQEGQVVFARPDYLALGLAYPATALLLFPPRRWSIDRGVFVAVLLFTLAVSTGPRFALYLPAAVLAARVEGRLHWKPALGAFLVGLLPSIWYVFFVDTFQDVLNEHLNTMSDVAVTVGLPKFPPVMLLLAVLGVVALWRHRPPGWTLWLLWGAATATQLVVPMNWSLWVLTGFMAYSMPLAAYYLSRLAQPTVPLREVAVGAVLLLLSWAPVADASDLLPVVQPGLAVLQGQVGLLNWLGDVTAKGPVVCVPPCHPIKAQNVWRLYNAWEYRADPPPARFRTLTKGLLESLMQGEPRVIEWDAFTEATHTHNIIDYMTQHDRLSSVERQQLVDGLRQHYRLVQYRLWKGPMPISSGKYLIQRSIGLDDRCEVLSDDLIAP